MCGYWCLSDYLFASLSFLLCIEEMRRTSPECFITDLIVKAVTVSIKERKKRKKNPNQCFNVTMYRNMEKRYERGRERECVCFCLYSQRCHSLADCGELVFFPIEFCTCIHIPWSAGILSTWCVGHIDQWVCTIRDMRQITTTVFTSEQRRITFPTLPPCLARVKEVLPFCKARVRFWRERPKKKQEYCHSWRTDLWGLL